MSEVKNRRIMLLDVLYTRCPLKGVLLHIYDLTCNNIITLCVYAQQGYAFGHVSLCMYVGTFTLSRRFLAVRH